MDLATLRSRLARRWWVVVAAAVLAVLGAATASGSGSDMHERTIHFVLRPDGSVSNNDLPGTLAALESDGSLVQTVKGVLGSQGMLRRAATDANMPFRDDYSIEATARPGTALIDVTLAATDEATVDWLAAAYTRAARKYVAASYSAYALGRVGADSGGTGTGPSTAQVLLLALLVGAALGVGLVLAEQRFESRLRTLAAGARRPAEPARRDRKPVGRRPTRAPRPEPAPRPETTPGPEPPGPEPARHVDGAAPAPAPGRKSAARPRSTAPPKSAARPKSAGRSKSPARGRTGAPHEDKG